MSSSVIAMLMRRFYARAPALRTATNENGGVCTPLFPFCRSDAA
jgi:hypothetical protein